MKLLKTSSLLCLTIILFSCSQQKEEVSYQSDGKNISITITGTRYTSMDPWDININVKGYGHDENLPLDMYNDGVNDKTTFVIWKDENSCTLTLKQSDGAHRILDLETKEGAVRLAERR